MAPHIVGWRLRRYSEEANNGTDATQPAKSWAHQRGSTCKTPAASIITGRFARSAVRTRLRSLARLRCSTRRFWRCQTASRMTTRAAMCGRTNNMSWRCGTRSAGGIRNTISATSVTSTSSGMPPLRRRALGKPFGIAIVAAISGRGARYPKRRAAL